MAKHLVTGGSGFLGSLIATKLLESGEEVVNLDLWRDGLQSPEIRFVQADIRDAHAVNQAMQGVDVVHHNVALVPLSKAGRDFWSVNVQGSKVAAEMAVQARVKKFIHMSSSAIFGVPQELPITSETEPFPVEIYGKGKLEAELAVRTILSRSQVDLSIIRPRTILGEGRLGIFQILFEWISEGRDVYTIGNGDGLFQFVHASDLMSAYMKTLQSNRPGTYNVGTEDFGTLKNALENLIIHAGSQSKVKKLPEHFSIFTLTALDKLHLSPLAPWHYKTFHKPYFFDLTELKNLGWQSEYSNDRMLQESYDWFVQNKRNSASDGASPHRRKVNIGVLRLLKKIS